MAKFAIIVPPLTGHINPTLSLGSELLDRGHEVGWISLDPALQDKLPAGGQLLLIRYDSSDAEKQETEAYLDIITRKSVYGIDSIKFLYEEVLVPLNRYMYAGIREQLLQFAPNVAIADHQMFAGAVAARQLNIPYATSVTAPAAIKVMQELPKVHEWEQQQIVALQKELGWPGEQSLDCSDALTLVFTSQLFFGEMALPDPFRFVGPVIANRKVAATFDWQAFQQMPQPRILVSIGTTFDHEHKRQFFAKVAEAFGDTELSVVVVSDPELFDTVPSNFMIQQRVPQLELLPQLQAVVCHGGHNTVCESLSHGLPMVVIPIAYDQSHVAGRVVRVGAGLRLNFNRFKAHHLKDAVLQVLAEDHFRNAANLIRTSFEATGGVKTAAAHLETLFTRNAPVLAAATTAAY
ncbi:glycosyltransferase [Taibaiella chishuiensis]|uniref:MGT family glycosyltransferase n=1 Tax=Taibaiella chishuiensis TaxID=1434707 RepID=A0A2P8D2M7_9BACT|nr:nucleotide disphospho-sugar-binding domain-containing protein [Taibaiella chishuiensis]PSK91470.1 MGT family glycosyltransferase [Taibaiella chishuiensis]